MITGALADAGKFRTMITMVFGLIHGFGFASNLLQMQLPTNRLAELLVGFNVGVEIAQLTLVLGRHRRCGFVDQIRLDHTQTNRR